MSIKAPEYFGEIAKQKWDELSVLLAPITENQVDALALLCCSWEDYLIARKDIDDVGRYLKSDVNGRTFINPAVNDRNEAWKQILKLSKAFGLVPSASNKKDDDDEDDMAAFLNGAD